MSKINQILQPEIVEQFSVIENGKLVEGFKVGFACCFENLVVYADNSNDVLRTIGNKKTGEFLGLLKGVVPTGGYQVPYEWINHTKGYKIRVQERKVLKNLKLSRSKMKTLKRNGQRTLTNFNRKLWTTKERNTASKKMIDRGNN